ARVLEQLYADRLEDHAAELAEHCAYSSDPNDLAKAEAFCEHAADRAMQVYAYADSVRHLDRALDLHEMRDPDDSAKQCELLLALGSVLILAGDPQRTLG